MTANLPDEGIEGIGGEFLDDEGGSGVQVRVIKSGRGLLARGATAGHSWARAVRSRGGPELIGFEDGRLGWRLHVPGSRPLATPAVSGGRLFIGGGFGSHEFYCFDAESGQLQWNMRTKDDGPTAATVAGEYVAFNTESCTIYVAEVSSGRVIWDSWLGDPLLAQPAMGRSAVFMAYPDRSGRHYLAALSLAKGKKLWETELIADVITAPIIAEGALYCAAIDGTVYRIELESGKRSWSINHRATSAPWVHRGRLYMSLRDEREDQAEPKGRAMPIEGLASACLTDGFRHAAAGSSRRRAAYLKMVAEERSGFHAQLDAGVGFASQPANAKLHLAAAHLGLNRVSSLWSFQGSRPEVFDDGIFNVLDDVVQRLELGSKKPLWRSRLAFEEGSPRPPGRVLNPPALTASRLYLSSSLGDVIALDRASGEEIWALNVGSPILSQPAVAGGKVFVGTADGLLYAIEADDPDAVGWPMWGGGPGHNGPESC